jgi:hypothetical protein
MTDLRKRLHDKKSEAKPAKPWPWWAWLCIGLIVGASFSSVRTVYVADDSAHRRLDEMERNAARERQREEDRLRAAGYKSYSDGTWRK